MSKKTIILILGLLIATALLLYVALYKNGYQKRSKELQVASKPVSPKESVLTISKEEASSSANVNILTGKNKVTAVQVKLSYDPEVLTNVDIVPGDFFTNSTILFKEVDKKDGRIYFTTAINPGESGVVGTGIVAKITYETRATTSGTTIIKFLPQTKVLAEGVSTSVLKNTVDGILKIEPKGMVGTSSAQ